jgi:GT2 family glycosyltransferase
MFIHVNYNSSNETINCVSSIIQSRIEGIELHIIIVDNNSSTQDKDKLVEWNKKQNSSIVKICLLKENIGYFPALNYGMLNSDKTIEADYVIVGNNDLIFKNDFIFNLSKKCFADDVYVVCPDIINKGDNHQNPHVKYKYSNLQLLYLELYHSNYCIASLISFISSIIPFRGSQKSRDGYDKQQYISIGYGACYVLTRRYLDKVKELPSYLFLMNEENALSNEVFKNDGRVLYDPDLIIYHLENTAVKKLIPKEFYEIEQKSYKISKEHFSNALLYDKKMKDLKNLKS